MAKHKVLTFIVSCAFIGYIPPLPGTYASLSGCLFIYCAYLVLGNIPFIAWFLFAIGFILFSMLCIHLLPYEGKDPRYIVIDELAGIFVTMMGHRVTFFNLFAGFLLFRFFDIIKPPPVRTIERLAGAYGIVGDDVVAGIFANLGLIIAGIWIG